MARGEPVKGGRGPTFSKTSSTPGSRQDDDRPQLVSPIPHGRTTQDTGALASRSPIQNIVDTVTEVMSTVTCEMQNARQDQQQMFTAMLKSQRQLISTIMSAQSKEVASLPPPPDLSKMGLEELLKLMTETEDGEEYMKIQQAFSVRVKALRTVKNQQNIANETVTPVPKSTSTPNSTPSGGGHVPDEKGKNETIVDGGALSKQLATASPEREIGVDENINVTPVIQ